MIGDIALVIFAIAYIFAVVYCVCECENFEEIVLFIFLMMIFNGAGILIFLFFRKEIMEWVRSVFS